MEVSKHVKSGSSSDESTDHHQEQAVKDEAGNTTKRPYECTYCKRGFTNAQALGGHMNIHRKDRAKAKQNHHQQHHHANTSVPKPPHGDYYDPISSQLPNYNYVGPEAQRNYHMYQLPPMASSPNYYPQADYHENDFSASRLEIDEERVGPNLSLRIGSSYMEEDREVMRLNDDQEKDEVDLELRLGPDP